MTTTSQTPITANALKAEGFRYIKRSGGWIKELRTGHDLEIEEDKAGVYYVWIHKDSDTIEQADNVSTIEALRQLYIY